jgi:hypothetical protein
MSPPQTVRAAHGEVDCVLSVLSKVLNTEADPKVGFASCPLRDRGRQNVLYRGSLSKLVVGSRGASRLAENADVRT